MKITEVIVSTGRTFNHPYEQYSNFRPGVTVKATLEEGETLEQVSKELRAKAESLVEDDKRNILESLKKLRQMAMFEERQASLEEKIKEAQEELDALRKGNALLTEGESGGRDE